jgi:hypothetical protein
VRSAEPLVGVCPGLLYVARREVPACGRGRTEEHAMQDDDERGGGAGGRAAVANGVNLSCVPEPDNEHVGGGLVSLGDRTRTRVDRRGRRSRGRCCSQRWRPSCRLIWGRQARPCRACRGNPRDGSTPKDGAYRDRWGDRRSLTCTTWVTPSVRSPGITDTPCCADSARHVAARVRGRHLATAPVQRGADFLAPTSNLGGSTE